VVLAIITLRFFLRAAEANYIVASSICFNTYCEEFLSHFSSNHHRRSLVKYLGVCKSTNHSKKLSLNDPVSG